MPELNPKILIVYDDESVRESLTTLMEREGFRTLQANNGKMGLDVIRTASPDLMLVEIKMSDADGINLLHEAKDLNPKRKSTISGTRDLNSKFGTFSAL
jgi:DNA-binding response OmpR family regulator